MNMVSRIVSIVLSMGLLILIFDLVRRRKLKEKYAVLWLITGISIFLLALFQRLLSWVIYLLGIKLPINGVFFLGLFFVVLINIHFSVVISNLVEQNKKITQKLALIEFEVKLIKDKN